MAAIIWTPEGADPALATVEMARPTQPVTRDRYRGALATRIDRMVRAETAERAGQILRETVEANEGLLVAARPEDAGDVLVFESSALAEAAGLTSMDWPIPAQKIKQSLDPMPEMTLAEYLGRLYPESV